MQQTVVLAQEVMEHHGVIVIVCGTIFSQHAFRKVYLKKRINFVYNLEIYNTVIYYNQLHLKFLATVGTTVTTVTVTPVTTVSTATTRRLGRLTNII